MIRPTIQFTLAAAACLAAIGLSPHAAPAQPPRIAQADIDYDTAGIDPRGVAPMAGGGFVMPANGQMMPGGVSQAVGRLPAAMAPGQMMAGAPIPPGMPGGPASPGGPMMGGPMMGGPMMGGVAPVGFLGGGCDDDTPGGCVPGGCVPGGCGGAMCGGGGCSGGCGMGAGGCGMPMPMSCGGAGCGSCSNCCMLSGGVLGKMCNDRGELSALRHLCLFCRGDGCGACQSFRGQNILACLGTLMPYTAGDRAMRWYDLSAEALFLGRTTSGIGTDVITRRGSGLNTPAVLTADQINDGGLETGARLSAAIIFGAGGNLETTWIGGHEWEDSATAVSPPVFATTPPFGLIDGADLFSFISNFGTDASGGLDDTDESISQTVESRARFHSGELNYRRRTMGPYSKFQGSWLFGMRYFRYDEQLGLNIVGLNDDGTGAGPNDGTLEFFNHDVSLKNDLFGGQIGGDLWYHALPGVRIGIGTKLAWLKNEVRNRYSIQANSIINGGPGEIGDQVNLDDGTLALEFQTAISYRISQSFTLRSAYYLMAIDEVARARFDADFITDVAGPLVPAPIEPTTEFSSLVLNGVSFGAEYTW